MSCSVAKTPPPIPSSLFLFHPAAPRRPAESPTITVWHLARSSLYLFVFFPRSLKRGLQRRPVSQILKRSLALLTLCEVSYFDNRKTSFPVVYDSSLYLPFSDVFSDEVSPFHKNTRSRENEKW